MSDNNKKPAVKYCVHCGAKVDKNQTYCPVCGKLVLKMKSDEIESKVDLTKEVSQLRSEKKISRTCPKCGSIITSPILEQCPICNAKLEKLPKDQGLDRSQVTQKSSGFVFTDKKLIPEQKLVLKKDIWNLREGISVFGSSLMAYITIRLLMIMLFISEDVNIFTLLLSQIPDMIFGVYPLWYIYSKKHNFRKLGFNSSKKKIFLAFIIAIMACVILFEISFFSDRFIEFLYNSGITFGFNLPEVIAQENLVIQEANILWSILLLVFLNIGAISTEIVFRGVLHNTLKNHFQNDFIGRSTVILLVALVYSLLFFVFFLPVSIYFFLLYFLNSILLGIIFEVNNNIYNTILASIFYNSVFIILIIFF